ncbi:hypothetical protein BVH06_24580 [Pseudomonas sp. PA27(2017)]|nr:hypothetical protein BVH06_24580 [Pseudomonas sp. PA27(2017)]
MGDQALTLRRVLILGQGSHVDHEAVFHVTLEHALLGFVDVLDVDHFDVRDDVVLGAEVEHLLGFGDATDQPARSSTLKPVTSLPTAGRRVDDALFIHLDTARVDR